MFTLDSERARLVGFDAYLGNGWLFACAYAYAAYSTVLGLLHRDSSLTRFLKNNRVSFRTRVYPHRQGGSPVIGTPGKDSSDSDTDCSPAGSRTDRAQSPWRGATVRTSAAVAGLVLIGALALAGCGDDDDDSTAPDTSDDQVTQVIATEGDGTIELDTASSDGGNVAFTIHNEGELTHEFVVLKTDLAEGDLPLTEDGTTVDQSDSGVEELGERDSIAPGATAELSFDDMEPGTYVLICNVPGHYGLGMHASFTVS